MTSRRKFLCATTMGMGGAFLARSLRLAAESGAIAASGSIVEPAKRFPHFSSEPVSYRDVKMQDTFWAPRQQVVREVTVPWATRHHDRAGGLEAYKKAPQSYRSQMQAGDLEAIKFIEAMASVVGLERDPSLEGLADIWGRKLIEAQAPDGYSVFGYPPGKDPAKRWQPIWYSHEDYAHGHYLEAAIAYREATGKQAMYDSAVRAMDNMAATFLGSNRAYAPGHQEIEQALMRLYGSTGDTKYLQLAGWLIEQRGHHEGRPDFTRYSQDHVPVKDQRTIEGHAVRAAFLFNGVTEYVGATGDDAYREALVSIWDDFEKRKMYLHGAGGNQSAQNEGYTTQPYFIPPNDVYGESCSAFANFQWAHNLFRLTGEARYLDAAERMLYNAFYASLSLQGDQYFYRNPAQVDEATLRHSWHGTPCCPPNIVKLFSKVGGFFYSTAKDGIYVKHYGASEAEIPYGNGVKLTQRTDFPWNGDIALQLEPSQPTTFALRLRVPAWAKSHALRINGKAVAAPVEKGWVVVHRHWKRGDEVELSLPMHIERVTMPPQFKEYRNLAALQRGPIVYCLEEQDVAAQAYEIYFPQDAKLEAQHRLGFLGGVTVLQGSLYRVNIMDGTETPLPVTFVPYGVWNNRTPGWMRIWLSGKKPSMSDFDMPSQPPGTVAEEC